MDSLLHGLEHIIHFNNNQSNYLRKNIYNNNKNKNNNNNSNNNNSENICKAPRC